MSDDYNDDETSDLQAQTPLEQFEGLFKTPTGQAFGQEARVRIADYAQKKQIAEANSAAGQAFTDNLGEMRGNLVATVREDPAATHLALDLAHLGTSAMVGSIPGLDQEHADNISTGMRQDIARAAVTTLAERHEGLARDLLDHPQISDLLGDEKDQLSGYITGQAVARKIDGQGAQAMAQRAAADRANQSSWQYMAAMVDPDTGQISHPPGWAERVMGDPTMPPPMKAQLFDIYGRLQHNGDAETSDPDVASDLLRGIAGGYMQPMTVLSTAGTDLRAADATYLAKLAGDPTMKRRAGEISTTLDAAQRALATPENGPAGQAAYQRFANWLIPTARDGADLNPNSKSYVLQGGGFNAFAPTPGMMVDQVIGDPGIGFAYQELRFPGHIQMQDHPDRMSLNEIFSGSRRPAPGDQVLRNTGRSPPIDMPTVGQDRVEVPSTHFGKGGDHKTYPGDKYSPPFGGPHDNVAVR